MSSEDTGASRDQWEHHWFGSEFGGRGITCPKCGLRLSPGDYAACDDAAHGHGRPDCKDEQR